MQAAIHMGRPRRKALNGGRRYRSGNDGHHRVTRARLAVMFFFLVDGTVFGSWFSRVPDVQQKVGLDHEALGVALLGAAAGALVIQTVAGRLIARWGSRRMTLVGSLAQCAVLTLPALATGMGALILSLVLLGIATGLFDVAMNVQGVEVERRHGRPVMSMFHACYSVGGLIGAIAGGVVASHGVATAPHLAGVALLFSSGILVAHHGLLPASPRRKARVRPIARPSRALVTFGVIAFSVVLAEGAMGDWTAIYLRQHLSLDAGMAAGGYAAFSLAMTVGRLAGGWLTTTLGSVMVIRLGGVGVAAGLLSALGASGPVAAFAGFACIGIGLACAFPVTLSAAGRLDGMQPGAAIAAINAAGYTGFLVGPPLIGLVSDRFGLDVGLGMLTLIGVVMIVLSGSMRSPDELAVTAEPRDLVIAEGRTP